MEERNRLIIPIILCGGEGKRLWPRSRKTMPKQFHNLFNELSLLQNCMKMTVQLKEQNEGVIAPVIVSNANRRFTLVEQLKQIQSDGPIVSTILYEPEGKNTAAAIATAVHEIVNQYGDADCICLPVDHLLDEKILIALQDIIHFMKSNAGLITLGIKPTEPSAQYGYLSPGDEIGKGFYWLDKFVEKPEIEVAEEYLKQGFLWNSGIYCFSAKKIAEAFQVHQPKLFELCHQALEKSVIQNGDLEISGATQRLIDAETYHQLSSISFDHGISEKIDKIVTYPYSGLWSDIGSWQALHHYSEKDTAGNAVTGDVLAHHSNNNYLYSESLPLVTLGVQDCFVFAMGDVVFVAHKHSLGAMGTLHNNLCEKLPQLTKFSNTVHRPWGFYENIKNEPNMCIKKITVNPKKRLSLQSHEYRSEHWLVISGTAEITLDDKNLVCSAGESVDIPIGCKHRLENKHSTELLEIIEVQRGEKLSEDDIKRYEDDFQRGSSDF